MQVVNSPFDCTCFVYLLQDLQCWPVCSLWLVDGNEVFGCCDDRISRTLLGRCLSRKAYWRFIASPNLSTFPLVVEDVFVAAFCICCFALFDTSSLVPVLVSFYLYGLNGVAKIFPIKIPAQIFRHLN